MPFPLVLVISDFGNLANRVYPRLAQLHPPPGSLPFFTPPVPIGRCQFFFAIRYAHEET